MIDHVSFCWQHRVSIYSIVSAIALIFNSNFALAEGETATDRVYAVKPGDILEISVWKEEGLQQEVLVRPDGKISFPLAGDILAEGRSLEELQEELVTRISKYIPDPVVTVTAKQLLGHRIYVIGKVNKPGEYVVNRNVDVMQALSIAGGMTPFSSVNNIVILRRKNGEQQAIPFEYGDVEDGDNLEQNIILQSGDVVVVP